MADSAGLMTQSEARGEAKRLNKEEAPPYGTAWIAVAVPESSWGGQEKGWTVRLSAVRK